MEHGGVVIVGRGGVVIAGRGGGNIGHSIERIRFQTLGNLFHSTLP